MSLVRDVQRERAPGQVGDPGWHRGRLVAGGCTALLPVLLLFVSWGWFGGDDDSGPRSWGRLALIVLGWGLVVGLTLIGLRMLSYYRGFAFHSEHYRQLASVNTAELRTMAVPYVKIQITTLGSPGSTEVVRRGIDRVAALAAEAPEFYSTFLSVEVVTESGPQAAQLEQELSGLPIPVEALVVPPTYRTPAGTALKARALHYAVERRRAGWNQLPGRTFVIHYDEESVIEPPELRKLLAALATTDRRILEGPIYYPLEYFDAAVLCRAMEAVRPLACYECRHVMEQGIPLHLHGSNLVVEEKFENELGWDMGRLDGQPFIAEDYVFGMQAFLAGGPAVFGWHGAVMLEQPPFSVTSARRQRHRWILGVLQGVAMLRQQQTFASLPRTVRWRLVWGTRFRVACFALSAPVGVLSLFLTPLLVVRMIQSLAGGAKPPLPPLLILWVTVVGLMWLVTVFIGAWYNVTALDLSWAERRAEIARLVFVAPVAGIVESTAAFGAVWDWVTGHREITWLPTPKTKAADVAMDWSAA